MPALAVVVGGLALAGSLALVAGPAAGPAPRLVAGSQAAIAGGVSGPSDPNAAPGAGLPTVEGTGRPDGSGAPHVPSVGAAAGPPPGTVAAAGGPLVAPVHSAAPRPPARAAAGTGAQQFELRRFPYDGRFTFTRIRFSSGGRGGFGRGGGPMWAHDYPIGEINFLKILTEVSYVESVLEGSNVFTFDDPELTRYPLAYIVEVGAWAPSPAEVEGLRAYLQKGGFLIVDDFRSRWELANFAEQMRRVFPGYQIHQLDETHEIFNSFFEIADLSLAPPTFQGLQPYYLGMFEDDDPSKRLMIMINYNNDIGEYWEYSDVGYYPIDLSNEAYKISVNYIIYALTH